MECDSDSTIQEEAIVAKKVRLQVTLTAEDGHSVAVPADLIDGIDALTVTSSDSVVNTKCKTKDSLDILVDFLGNGSSLNYIFTTPNRDVLVNLLMLSHIYDLPRLGNLAMKRIGAVDRLERSAKFRQDGDFELSMNLSVLNIEGAEGEAPFFVYIWTGEKEDTRQRVKVPRVDIKKYFEKVDLTVRTREPLLIAKHSELSIFDLTCCSKEILELIIKFTERKITMEEIPEEQLLPVAKTSCVLGYRELFYLTTRKHYHELTQVMAEDIYELFYKLDRHQKDSLIDNWFREIEIHFSNTEWQSGQVIPMSLRIWRNKASEIALEADNVFVDLDDGETGNESLTFLPRNLLLAHLSTYLLKHPKHLVQRTLLRKYPRHVREFIRDPEFMQIPSVTNRDVLFELLKLASEFEIEALYFRAYARMLLLELPLDYIPPLHLHAFSPEEVLQQKESDKSPFTTLIAEDGSRGKVLEKYLLKKTEYFPALSNFNSDQTLPLVHSICKDIKVLDTWIQFLHRPKLSNKTEDQTLVDSIMVADYYQIADGMLFEVLSKLNAGLSHATARMVYEHLPIHYEKRQNDKLRELIHSMKERLERDFLEEISDSHRLGQLEAPRFLEVVNSCRDTELRDKVREKWLDLAKPQPTSFSNKCSRKLEGADKLCEIVSPCGILLYQTILKSTTISDCKFFSYHSDYTFDQISSNISFLPDPQRDRSYLHQRKFFSFDRQTDLNFVLDLDTEERNLLPSIKNSKYVSYVFYLGTLLAFDYDEKEDMYKYDMEKNCWTDQIYIYKEAQIPFRGKFIVFGDLLVAIHRDDFVAYLRPSRRPAYDYELKFFETTFPDNAFENVIGVHKKKMAGEKSKQFWCVFKKRSFLILQEDDLKLLAEVQLPTKNNRPWWKAISSGGERVCLVLNDFEKGILDIFEVKIELNECEFEQTQVALEKVIELRPERRNVRTFTGIVERVVGGG